MAGFVDYRVPLTFNVFYDFANDVQDICSGIEGRVESGGMHMTEFEHWARYETRCATRFTGLLGDSSDTLRGRNFALRSWGKATPISVVAFKD